MKDADELLKQLEELKASVARLENIDADDLFSGSRKKRSDAGERPRKPKANEKPEWVKAWTRANASNGRVKTIAKTTDTYHENSGIVESKTELVEPVTTTKYQRNLVTEEIEEVTETAGLPEHLRLDKLHDERASPIDWATRPEHGTIAPHGLTQREVLQYEADHPSPPANLRDEGPTKPVRKQMLRLNQVWKYRNFKKCGICDCYDTWESRTDPYADGPRSTHAEVWCQTCGAVDFEVSDSMPAHIGTWAPPKETEKQTRTRHARQAYRRQRAIFSLVQAPKTPMELTLWFREVEKYEAVDPIMLELMLKRMRTEGLVVLEKDGRWWDREDWEFEHSPKSKSEGKEE